MHAIIRGPVKWPCLKSGALFVLHIQNFKTSVSVHFSRKTPPFAIPHIGWVGQHAGCLEHPLSTTTYWALLMPVVSAGVAVCVLLSRSRLSRGFEMGSPSFVSAPKEGNMPAAHWIPLTPISTQARYAAV